MTNKGADSSFKLEKQFIATEALGGHHVAQNYLPKLFQDLGINHQAKILDVGCGIGIMVRTLREIGIES
jgi:2-polyprenyl-3-methyl-5-hydroxy-6-metoxy-1,4-benzoquinol methylase